MSAAMNPAKPPVAPENVVPKLCQVPLDAVNVSRATATMMTQLQGCEDNLEISGALDADVVQRRDERCRSDGDKLAIGDG